MKQSQRKLDPSTPSVWYAPLAAKYALVNTLLGGTEAMRGAGETYLPRHEREENRVYVERLSQAFLHPLFENTVQTLASKPFTDRLTADLGGNRYDAMLADIDGEGRTLDQFCRHWFEHALAYGVGHVLVETDTITTTVEATEDDGAIIRNVYTSYRPRWKFIAAPDLFAAGHVTLPDGTRTLGYVRYLERQTVRDGFEEYEAHVIRELVLNGQGTVTANTYTLNERRKWILAASMVTDATRIPLHSFFAGNRTGDFSCLPPLLKLAETNVEHWQKKSDYDSIIRVAGFPLLGVSGSLPDDDGTGGQELIIGPRTMVRLPDPASKAYYIEHSGAAISCIRQAILDVEDRASEFGLHMLRRKSGNISATARALDEVALMAPLESLALAFRSTVETALAATFDTSAVVEMTTDFGIDAASGEDLKTLLAMEAAGVLSAAALRREMMRRGVLADDFDEDRNAREIEAQLPRLPRRDDPEGLLQ